jgi:hypothetical protein
MTDQAGTAESAAPGFVEKLAVRIEATTPQAAFMATLVAGAALLLFSYVLGLNKVECGPAKLAFGYASELNWGLMFALFVPVATLAVFLFLRATRQATTAIVAARMLVGSDGSPVSEKDVARSWHVAFSRSMQWTLWVALAAFAESYWEWYTYLVKPILWHVESGRCGWFTASAMNGASPIGNLAFGFVAYSMQAVGIVVFGIFLFTAFAFSEWLEKFGDRPNGIQLLPNTSSSDSRLGFQALEPVIVNMLWVGLAYFAVFFLTRIQFLFAAQHVDVQHPGSNPITSVTSFVSTELIANMVTKPTKISWDRVLDIGPLLNADLSVVFATLAVLILVVISWAVPTGTLKQAALQSRSRNLTLLDEGSEIVTRTGRSAAEERSRLETMEVWPVRYLTPVLLRTFLVAATAAFLCYRLTFLLVGATVVAAILTVLNRIRGNHKGDSTHSQKTSAGRASKKAEAGADGGGGVPSPTQKPKPRPKKTRPKAPEEPSASS